MKIRLEPAALAVLSVVSLTLLAALVAVLAGSGTPVPVLLAGGLLLTGPPAVWLLVRAARRQEEAREIERLARQKDGPARAEQPADGPKRLHYS